MRVLAVDLGRRRIGLAISDPSGTLARPLATLTLASAGEAVERVANEVNRLAAEDDGLAEVVVGVPRHLDGSASVGTAATQAFIKRLQQRIAVPIATEDERLTSREAEERLAIRETDWRQRKLKLDAAAAAVILQDYLDRKGRAG